MIYPRTPYGIVALLGQVNGGFREIYLEISLNEKHQGGPLIVSGPLGPLLPGRVDSPFNFHVLA